MDYSVLVVDDEPEIAEGISFLLKRYCKECRVLAQAYSGEEGFARALELKPDIILTDVRMPGCDGLEMIRRLRQEGTTAKFVILTGFAEFEYARTAIALRAADFITKPVEEDELSETIKKVCAQIAGERSKNARIKSMQGTVYQYLLRDYLNGAHSHGAKIAKWMEQQGFSAENGIYVCLLLELEETPASGNVFTEERVGERLERALQNQMREQQGTAQDRRRIKILTVREGPQSFAVAASFRGGMTGEKLCAYLEQYVEDERENGTSLSIGMGLFCHRTDQLPKSLEEARLALNYRLIKGKSSVTDYGRIGEIQAKSDIVPEEEIVRLEECISRLDNQGIKNAVEEIFDRFLQESALSPEDLQTVSLKLVLAGMHKIPFAQMQMNRYLGKNIFSLESIAKFQTIEQLKNWIINTLQGMNELMLRDKLPQKRDVVQEAKDYIASNYNKEISLNDISREFYINPYYFSQLFKRKTGVTYQNYLIAFRVERAKKLLDETELRIYEVCQAVGYADVNHFNRIFERETGVKPGEWRKRHI